ncbi:MAG: neutral/alkaline non-lysosomal ceramidase N-terminal domain-containing protein [Candidatus Omnitrophota bacterium]|nr:neutral/alkaline non-lysosomal ceramidase N-terminal domain-containing protein [Candidatus Omnitrophota bacterium]
MWFALCMPVMPASAMSTAEEVQAGVARQTFALPRGVPLAGYSHRGGAPSQGQHDPVGVRALVVSKGATVAALVSCELLIVDERLFEAVRRRLIAQGFPADGVLLLAATHTHSGPGAFGAKFVEKVSMGHFDPAVFDALAQALAQAVWDAYTRRSPARIASRRAPTEGLVVNRMDASAVADEELVVCALYRPDAVAPFAVLVSFAAHPTTLGAWNLHVSGDYPGVVMREVERRLPGATCFFFAGAVGDQAPVKAGIGFERSEWVGAALTRDVIALLEPLSPEPPRTLQALQERLILPPARVRLGSWVTLPRWMGRALVDDDATLSLLVIGRVAFLGVPCDLSAALGQQLKTAAVAQRLDPLIVGFASDYIGYCLSESQYAASTYEASMAFNGPKAGELIVEHLTHMLDRLVTRDM